MSLIDLILSQKIILISLAAALLLMMVAVLLAVTGRLRTLSAKRAQQSAQQRVELDAELQELRALRASHTVGHEGQDAIAIKAPQVGARGTKRTNTPATQVNPEAGQNLVKPATSGPTVAAAALGTEQVDSAAEQPDIDAQSGPSNEMQNILASVFVDDELMARYDVLLRGLKGTSMDELLVLCQKVAKQMSGGGMSVVANKEQR